jgi:uncharacterized protein (TIGR02001 family)
MRRASQWILASAVTMGDPMAALADDSPVSKVIGSVSMGSDYIFRGLSQTNRKPALPPSIDYDDASGWYVGAWASKVSWLSDVSTDDARVSNSVEIDGYAGYRGSLSPNWAYDVGLYTYYYPGTYPASFTRPYTTEAYASPTWQRITLTYSYGLTNLFGFANSKHSGYVDLSYNYEVTPGWTLNSHVGHQDVPNTPGSSYADWRVGVTRAFTNGYSVALGYYDTHAKRRAYTNLEGHFVGRAAGILTLS